MVAILALPPAVADDRRWVRDSFLFLSGFPRRLAGFVGRGLVVAATSTAITIRRERGGMTCHDFGVAGWVGGVVVWVHGRVGILRMRLLVQVAAICRQSRLPQPL